MKKLLFALLFCTPLSAQADPVLITAGVVTWQHDQTLTVDLTGSDGTNDFRFVGSGNAVGPSWWNDRVIANLTASGLDLGGMMTYGNESYGAGSLDNESGTMMLDIVGDGPWPTVTDWSNAVQSIVPFSLTERTLFYRPNFDTVALLGTGLAYLTIQGDVMSARYEFTQTAHAPESGTIVLLTMGLFGVWQRRKVTCFLQK